MKSFDTEIKKYSEKISLKASERRELRERVLSYMEYHPLPKQTVVTEELKQALPFESFTVFHFNALHARIAGGVFVLFLVIAPFVAERSVPGDVLYLVKTGFNETIQGQFAGSPYEKIEFETKLMERRITEARVLASEGKLTEEVKTQIADTVKEHTVAVQDGLAELRTQDAEGAAIAEIAFNSSLEVQSAVLDANVSNENDSLIETILTVVNEAREGVVLNQEESSPSFDGLMARVELETTRAYELFETIKISATPEEISDIERRLSDVNRLIVEAKRKNTSETEIAADDLAVTLGLIQKLVVFMTDIDVREAVTLETLIPVVLSDAERTSIVQEEIKVIAELSKEITARLELMDAGGVKEKVVDGLVQIDALLATTTKAFEISDIQTAETSSQEARALINDLDVLTQFVVETGLPTTEEPSLGTDTATDTEVATSTDEVSNEAIHVE